MKTVKTVRLNVGLSQAEMAQTLGVSLSLYTKVEQSKVPASRAFMEKFKRRFPNENIDLIFFGNNSDNTAVSVRSEL